MSEQLHVWVPSSDLRGLAAVVNRKFMKRRTFALVSLGTPSAWPFVIPRETWHLQRSKILRLHVHRPFPVVLALRNRQNLRVSLPNFFGSNFFDRKKGKNHENGGCHRPQRSQMLARTAQQHQSTSEEQAQLLAQQYQASQVDIQREAGTLGGSSVQLADEHFILLNYIDKSGR